MRRATGITLVLLGGGLALGLSTCSPSRECREARVAGRPDAEQLCRSSGGSRGISSIWHGGSSRGDAASTSSTRGGFGSTASYSGGGG